MLKTTSKYCLFKALCLYTDTMTCPGVSQYGWCKTIMQIISSCHENCCNYSDKTCPCYIGHGMLHPHTSWSLHILYCYQIKLLYSSSYCKSGIIAGSKFCNKYKLRVRHIFKVYFSTFKNYLMPMIKIINVCPGTNFYWVFI